MVMIRKEEPFERPEATTWSVDDILRHARAGLLSIPKFQRNFRWDAEDVRKLFDSIYRGYPIGDLLLWETEQKRGASAAFAGVQFHEAAGRGYVIIDGQQRITSLVAALLGGPTPDAQFRVGFDLERQIFVTLRGGADVPAGVLPLTEVAETVRFLEWLQRGRPTHEMVNSANRLVRALRDYRVPVYIVRATNESKIREIFERLNTTGKRLEATEIFKAIHGGRGGLALEEIADELSSLDFGVPEGDWLLKSVAAVVGVDVTKNLGDALRKLSADEVESGLEATKHALAGVIRFLKQDARVPHISLLPYRFPLAPLTKFFRLVPRPRAETRRQLASWLWRGVKSGAHSRTDAPTIRAVLKDVTADESATLGRLLRSTPIVTERYRLRHHDFRAAGTKTVCAVLAVNQPRDLFSDSEIDVVRLLDRSPASAFHKICRSIDGDAGTENRILHEGDSSGDFVQAIIRASKRSLKSHFVEAQARAALASGDSRRFLEFRRSTLESAVNDFLDGWMQD